MIYTKPLKFIRKCKYFNIHDLPYFCNFRSNLLTFDRTMDLMLPVHDYQTEDISRVDLFPESRKNVVHFYDDSIILHPHGIFDNHESMRETFYIPTEINDIMSLDFIMREWGYCSEGESDDTITYFNLTQHKIIFKLDIHSHIDMITYVNSDIEAELYNCFLLPRLLEVVENQIKE